VCKAFWEKGREKSSEMTKYSVPSFGGHIDFSDEVTLFPVPVMARFNAKLRAFFFLNGLRFFSELLQSYFLA